MTKDDLLNQFRSEYEITQNPMNTSQYKQLDAYERGYALNQAETPDEVKPIRSPQSAKVTRLYERINHYLKANKQLVVYLEDSKLKFRSSVNQALEHNIYAVRIGIYTTTAEAKVALKKYVV